MFKTFGFLRKPFSMNCSSSRQSVSIVGDRIGFHFHVVWTHPVSQLQQPLIKYVRHQVKPLNATNTSAEDRISKLGL